MKADDVCVKPVGDGCSTGVARLRCVDIALPPRVCRRCECRTGLQYFDLSLVFGLLGYFEV
jgi:hypothetical protein